MKRSYVMLSLRRKLGLAITGSSFLILSLSIAASFLIELNAYREQLLNEYRTITRILASNVEAAVAFQDERDTREALNVLGEKPNIEWGGVFLDDGTLLAQYSRSSQVAPIHMLALGSGSRFQGGYIFAIESVVVDEREIGKVAMVANNREVTDFLVVRGLISGALIAVAVALAAYLATRLSQIVSRPMLELAHTARRITEEQDFSTRQEQRTQDETGRLVAAFNEMMAEIERGDDRVRSSEAKFRGFFDSGIIGAGVLDTSLKWTEANEALQELLGKAEVDLQGRLFSEFFENPFDEADSSSLMSKLEYGLTVDCWLSNKGENRRYTRVSLRRIGGLDSEAERILVLVSDITDRKLHEEEILKEKERVEKLSKAKDEFLSVISHELRTPLNPIIGYVEMLQREKKRTDGTRLDLIHDSAVHLLGLINNILDYSRIDGDQLSLYPEWLDYRGVCRSGVELLAQEAKEKGIEISYLDASEEKEAPSVPRVKADRVRLRQVLFNLLGNAVKFTKKGSIQVRSRLSVTSESSGKLRMEIEDTGIGIDPSHRNKLFDPFAQADTSLSREYDGLGLGLAIAKKIVTTMGGELDFESELGKGSLFWIEIPVEISTAVDGSIKSGVDESYAPRSKGKILLAEDELVNREMAISMLEGFGQQVWIARDREEAIALAEERDFDLIVMDVMMPRMSGPEAVTKIRAMKNGRECPPIVAVSARVAGRDEEKIGAFDEWLSKPYTLSKLVGVIDRWIIARDGKPKVKSPVPLKSGGGDFVR